MSYEPSRLPGVIEPWEFGYVKPEPIRADPFVWKNGLPPSMSIPFTPPHLRKENRVPNVKISHTVKWSGSPQSLTVGELRNFLASIEAPDSTPIVVEKHNAMDQRDDSSVSLTVVIQ